MSRVAELDEIAGLVRPLSDASGFDSLLERTGDARFVLIGDASHGTAEFYRWRAALTKRLNRRARVRFCRDGGRLAGLLRCQLLGQGSNRWGR